MTLGARPGLVKLHKEFGARVEFVSVYVREAHPGENYPHHTSEEQKMRQALDWKEQDPRPWTVAVDDLGGATHKAYGPLPNSAYLIDKTGHVAFRALWAGQESLLRNKIEELLKREAKGDGPVNLGQQENLVIPLIHGAAEFETAVARGGKKAKEDFRREMGTVIYGLQMLLSKIQPVINPGNAGLNEARD